MNYSTLKKTVALSLVSALAVGMAKAQTSSSAVRDTMKMSSATTTPKVFGGIAQYNTWSIGVNAGVQSSSIFTGGSNDDVQGKPQLSLGYGLSVQKQLAHSFALRLDLHGGQLQGQNDFTVTSPLARNYVSSFKTDLYSAGLSGVVNVATVDWLHRKDAVLFYLSAGYQYMWYQPVVTYTSGHTGPYTQAVKDAKAYGLDHQRTFVKEVAIPVGLGFKFKLSDMIALDLGYTENFTDGDNLDGITRVTYHKDRYSYGYAGLDFTLGSKSKPSLEWTNPVALMYDELYDEALRQEVAALKTRVTNVENSVNDLKKDSDGDGVSDQFDKCPNTPAGTVVDGAGCEIKFPTPPAVTTTVSPVVVGYGNIQFDFDSSVLRTSSYAVLDATSADLRTSGASVEVDGFASSEGTAAHNMRLSKDRASSVKTYLVNSGVDAKKVKVKGFGETRPIADNSTEEGRVLNRRVEFKK